MIEYLTLNNGNIIPIIGFGTWDLRGKACEEKVAEAIDIGYRLIDTAKMYGNEQEIGKVLQKTSISREELFVTTKLNHFYANYHKAKKGIKQSLEDLQLDYIDLFLIHEPYRESLEMYKALEEAYQDGIVKAIGVSNFNEKQYLNLVESCSVIPMINQVESHVFFQQFQLQKMMKMNGTLMEAWSPLASGKKSIFNNEVLIDIGKKHNKSAAQVALKYLMQNDIIVIPKSSNSIRMRQNIELFDFELETQDLNEMRVLDGKRSLFGWYE